MRVFKIGLIGYGYWGRILSRYFQYHQGFELIQVAARHPEKIEIDASSGTAVTTPAEVLENPEIDAVVVATPIGTHFPLIKEALERGKHVFSEKPLTLSSAHAREAAELAKQKNLKLFTDYIFTFSPAVRHMIRLAADGAVGRVHGCCFQVRQSGHFANSVYWDLGSHILSILDLLIPLDRLEFQHNDILVRDGIVETGQITFFPKEEDSGGRGSIFLSFNHPVKERNMTIYGEKGTLVYDMLKPQPLLLDRYRVSRGESRDALDRHLTTYEFDEMNTLREVVQGFYDTLTGAVPPNVGTAVRVTETLERMTVR